VLPILAHHVHAARRIAGACTLILALGLTACGGGSSSSSTAAQAQQQGQPGRNGRGAFLQDPKVQACLKKQGVTIPTFRRPQNGQAPNGQPRNGQPPSGQAPNGQRRNRNNGDFEKLRAALQKCGVTFPNPGNGGGPPPGQGTDTNTSAS
jgi:hypothetical protein